MNSTFPPSSQSMARPMIRERGKVFPSASTLIKGRAGERVRTERENSSGALIKRNINQRDDMAMYEPLHLLLKRFPLPFERRPPPALLPIRISTGAFAHVGVFVCCSPRAFGFSLSRRCEFFSLRRTPFFVPLRTGAAVITKKNISADENVLKCGSEFTLIPVFPAFCFGRCFVP